MQESKAADKSVRPTRLAATLAPAIEPPILPGVCDVEDHEQQQQRRMVEFRAEVAPHRGIVANFPWAKPGPKSLYSPKSMKDTDVAMRAKAIALDRAGEVSGTWCP